MEKIFIKNRDNKNICVVVEQAMHQKGLAFVMHGLGGYKEQSHVRTFAQSFIDNNFTVVLFDTRNTFGESEGEYADATTTNYYEDLEDVINWSKTQVWYQEPFWLVGHSLGGISTALYAENFSEKVKALAPISTVVSGLLSKEKYSQEELKEWERTGWRSKGSSSKFPGLIKKIKWDSFVDRLKYDLLKKVDQLTMPVLMIVGDNDKSTPLEHQKILFNELPGQKELHIIKNGPHTFTDPDQLAEIKIIFDAWIKKYL